MYKRIIIAAALAIGGLALAGGIAVYQGDNQAQAASEYTCGQHRNAKCHTEPRNDDKCYSNSCYGRCGPGCGWSALGSQYTSACQNHDGCIKTRRCVYGDSQWQSHANCAGGLPSAVGSWVQSHWNYGFQWAKDYYSGHRKKVRSCCN